MPRSRRASGGVLALDCAVNFGASGAPVLEGEGAEARLVAVVSAMGRVLATGRRRDAGGAAEPGIGGAARGARGGATGRIPRIKSLEIW